MAVQRGRVRSVVAKANSKLSLKWAAILLSGSTFVSSLLGLYRERLLNGLYYDTYKVGLDAYTAAFQIPDFMFFILVSGALSVSFIPVFNQRLSAGNRRSAWQLSSSMINFMALITLVASIFIIIFADPLVGYIVGPGLDETGHALAVSMMRVIAVNPFLFAVATVIASMQQAIGRFTFYTLAPMIYNIGIIIGALFFTNGIRIFGIEIFDGGIMGVALGVVLGSVMQLIVSSIGLLGMGFDYQFKISWKNKAFRQTLGLLPARSLDQGMDYVNGIVEANLASRMSEGTLRAYSQASSLSLMPVNLIGAAIGNAAFPQMTQRLAEGRTDLFIVELRQVLRVIVWLAFPIATVTYFGRGYIVNFIKNGGDSLIAGLLGALVAAMFFRTIYHIAARAFYAQQDTKTPLYISLFAVTLNIALAIYLTQVLRFNAYGLAWAQSFATFVEVVILMIVLARRMPGLFNTEFLHAIGRMAAASGLTGLVSYTCVVLFQLRNQDQSFVATFPKFFMIVMISFIAYIWISRLLHLEEVNPVIKRIKHLLFSRIEGR